MLHHLILQQHPRKLISSPYSLLPVGITPAVLYDSLVPQGRTPSSPIHVTPCQSQFTRAPPCSSAYWRQKREQAELLVQPFHSGTLMQWVFLVGFFFFPSIKYWETYPQELHSSAKLFSGSKVISGRLTDKCAGKTNL